MSNKNINEKVYYFLNKPFGLNLFTKLYLKKHKKKSNFGVLFFISLLDIIFTMAIITLLVIGIIYLIAFLLFDGWLYE